MIEGVLPLLGVWEGEGVAFFPTITRQEYREQLRFMLDEPHAVIQYEQKTWRKPGGMLLHWEFGFIRFLPDGTLTLNNTQNNGRVEVMTGHLAPLEAGFELTFSTRLFGNDPRMIEASRQWCAEGDILTYEHAMATQNVADLQPHLRAVLHKCAESSGK